jgi:hypothetical protein
METASKCRINKQAPQGMNLVINFPSRAIGLSRCHQRLPQQNCDNQFSSNAKALGLTKLGLSLIKEDLGNETTGSTCCNHNGMGTTVWRRTGNHWNNL